jgi:ribosomal protein L24E
MCGMHVAEHLAIAVRTDNEVMHFCSAECRDKYLGSGEKMAANG